MGDETTGWRPTSISLTGQPLNTATRPALVSTDAGDAYLKAAWPDVPANVLAREFIGLSLARLMGLEAPECVVYDLAMAEVLRDMRGEESRDGPALLTRRIKWAYWDGTSEGFRPVRNKAHAAGLVVLDTWLRNTDRFPPRYEGVDPPGPENGNLQNVALSTDPDKLRALRLRAVDFSNTLCLGTDLDPALLGDEAVADPGVYGLFEPFTHVITREHVDHFVSKLESLPSGSIQGIVDGVPTVWWPSDEARTAATSFLLQRGEFVRTRIKAVLGAHIGWL